MQSKNLNQDENSLLVESIVPRLLDTVDRLKKPRLRVVGFFSKHVLTRLLQITKIVIGFDVQ